MKTIEIPKVNISQRFEHHLAELSKNGTQPFADLPSQSGKCPHTGLRRGFLLNLPKTSGGLVRVVKLSTPGSKRGKLLVDLPRLLAFIRANEDLQDAGGVH